MWLCHLSVYAQTDGFDPVSPPNPPSQEVKDSATYRYHLTVGCLPYNNGGLNTTGGEYVEGEAVWLYAWSVSGFKFRCWKDEAGTVLSTSYEMK